MKKKNVNFLLRLAAFWIDLFVIYSLCRVLIVVFAIAGFRISFEVMFISLGAVYSFVMLNLYRQTAGKMIMQMMVVSASNGPVTYRELLIREIFGKWGITVSLPMVLGSYFLGNRWIPTVFDILILLPGILASMVYYLFTGMMWYEKVAGLNVAVTGIFLRAKTGFYILIVMAFAGIGIIITEYAIEKRIQPRVSFYNNMKTVRPLVRFLAGQTTDPVSYIIGLFDKYDVVVLAERAHPEMTQYDLIHDIISHPDFIKKSGIVFSEIGQKGMQDYLDEFMGKENLTDEEIHDRVIHIMRNDAIHPAWENRNIYNYYTRLYHLNRTLSPDRQVRHFYTDSEMDWQTVRTKEDYQEYWRKFVWYRDENMARTVMEKMSEIEKLSGESPKCLVIMNYRHAMDLTGKIPEIERRNTYEFIKDEFGDSAANVLVNTRIPFPMGWGRWDAAFEKAGNSPVGFDLYRSPFGSEPFNLFPFRITKSPWLELRYSDVYDGFVFTGPSSQFYFDEHSPGYYLNFDDEFIRRALISNNKSEKHWKEYIRKYNNRTSDTAVFFDNNFEIFLVAAFYGLYGVGFIIGVIAFSAKLVCRNSGPIAIPCKSLKIS